MAQFDNTKSLTGFKALSFDCYGTLVDWESGLLRALEPITSQLPPAHPWAADPKQALLRFDALCTALEQPQQPDPQQQQQQQQEQQPPVPAPRFDRLLATAMRQLAAEAGLAQLADADVEAMAAAPGSGDLMPAFGDTVAALRSLRRRYRLVLLTNADRANAARARAGALGCGGGCGGDGDGDSGDGDGDDGAETEKKKKLVVVDAVYTAEDVGRDHLGWAGGASCYKPQRANFDYLFARLRDEFGAEVGRGEVLHVARSLRVDHTAARALGFPSCWIARGGDRREGEGVGGDYERMAREGEISFQWKFDTLGDLAKEVARQFGDEEPEGL